MEKKIAQGEHSLFGYLFYGQCADYARTVQTCVQFWFSVLSNQIQTLNKTETIFRSAFVQHVCTFGTCAVEVHFFTCTTQLHNYYIVMCNCDFLSTVFRATQIFYVDWSN